MSLAIRWMVTNVQARIRRLSVTGFRELFVAISGLKQDLHHHHRYTSSTINSKNVLCMYVCISL